MRNTTSEMETERQKLKEDLAKAESRAARLEIQRIALDGDLNRLQMLLQEKDVHAQVIFFSKFDINFCYKCLVLKVKIT